MCGIVGLFLKDNNMNNHLGQLLSNMLSTMSDRRPDSSGIAIYNKSNDGQIKLTLRSEDPDQDLKKLIAQPIIVNFLSSHLFIRSITKTKDLEMRPNS